MTEGTLKFTAKVNFFQVVVSLDEIVSHGSCPEELKHGGMKLWQKAVTVRPSRLKSPEARRPVCMQNRPERKGKLGWFGRKLEKT